METILLLASVAVLFELTKSTEKILDIRQHRRDQGTNSQTYL